MLDAGHPAPAPGEQGGASWDRVSANSLQDLGVKYLRTGLSWADYYRDNSLEWFDRQMKALEPFDVTVTYCFTPEHKGVQPHHTSPPTDVNEFGEFCAEMTRRYAS